MLNINNSTHPPYRPDIDGLRAIAVLSVVIYHAFPRGVLKGGFIGVDIFFVISGYLISLILLGDLGKERFSFAVFYSRRILRIFPALAVVLLFCLLIGWFFLLPDEFNQIGKHAAGGAAFIANLVFWDEVGYFDNAAELKPLLHLWSLGVEEQFYIIWPALLLLTWRNKLGFLRTVIILGTSSFALSCYITFINPTYAFFSPLTRFWELMVGGALAYLTVHDKYSIKRHNNLQSVVGILLIVVGLLKIKASYKFPGFWALLPVTGTFLVISAGPSAWLNRLILSSKPMVYIGLVSYPLYLWHWPLLSFLRIVELGGGARDTPFMSRLIAVISALILSWGTYRFIEKPIRYGEKKQFRTITLVVLIAVIGVFGLVIYLTNGVPSRIQLNPPNSSVLFSEYPHPRRNETCKQQYPELKSAWSCLLSKPQQASVAIIGDSHAHQYYKGLANKLLGASVLNFSVPGCLPFSSNYSLSSFCNDKFHMAIEFFENNYSIDTIILTGYFSYLAAGFEGENVEGQRVAKVLDDKHRHAFQESANRMLSVLLSLNRKVVVILDIPDLVFRPRDCVTFENPVMAFIRGTKNKKNLDQCGISVEEYRLRVRKHDEVLLEILAKYPNVEILDPRPLFCDERICAAYKDNHFLYWNSDHLTEEGADLVIDHLLEKTHVGSLAKVK